MAKKTSIRPTFTADVVEELKRVTWPTRKVTVRLTLVVIVITLLIAVYIGIIDMLLAKALAILTHYR